MIGLDKAYETTIDFSLLTDTWDASFREKEERFDIFHSPFFEINAAGYDAKILGQKSYNGVAILSRHKITVSQENLPNFKDENARYLEALEEDSIKTQEKGKLKFKKNR